jgi:serine protease Do
MMPSPGPTRGVGSGFIVSPDGYIVTNAHVVDDASEVTVKLTDRREFTAKVIGQDKRTDIALIKIDAKNLPALDLSSPPPVKKGEWVIAIGSPFGFENSVSAGIVSGVHRALPGGQMTPFIQTDVAVNPGNSGGPLLNSAGQVVGVNSQIYSRSGGYMGLSFAIPADVAASVADQLRTHGKVAHGRIGVGIQGLDQSLAQSFGLPDSNGALVGTVEKDSPASKAGFKAGDIIRKIDGVAVNDSTDVTSKIGNMAPGTKTDVQVWRDGKPVDLAVTIGSFDDEKVATSGDKSEHHTKLGLAARPLTGDERQQVGHDGLVVEQATGPAALAGIQPGDVIVGVGTTKVKSVDQLRKLVEKSGKTVALLIERDGRQIYVPIRVG